jgi:hypothetical protein
MAEMDIGRGRVGAVFDPKTPSFFGSDLQFFLQFVGGKEIHMPGGQKFKLFCNIHSGAFNRKKMHAASKGKFAIKMIDCSGNDGIREYWRIENKA